WPGADAVEPCVRQAVYRARLWVEVFPAAPVTSRACRACAAQVLFRSGAALSGAQMAAPALRPERLAGPLACPARAGDESAVQAAGHLDARGRCRVTARGFMSAGDLGLPWAEPALMGAMVDSGVKWLRGVCAGVRWMLRQLVVRQAVDIVQ